MATVNEDLQDATIRHQIFLTRVQNGVARRMLTLLNRSEDELVASIARLDPTSVAARFQRMRMERLLEDITDLTEQLRRQMGAELRGELEDVATAERAFQAEALARSGGRAVGNLIETRFEFLTPQRVRAAALARPFQSVHLKWATQSDHLRELMRRRGELVRGAIQQGFIQGETIGQIIRRVRGTRRLRFADGILNISRRATETMVRTAVNHTANAARQFLYEQNEDLVKGIRYLAILDSRTTPICRALDGNVYPIDSGPRPPQHPNCRSTTAPVMKSFRDIGLDVDDAPGIAGIADGKVAPYQSYNDWLRTQPKSFVEDVLGKTKAKLYLDGDLPLDRFVDRSGAELTIDELRTKEAAAFEAAGLA